MSNESEILTKEQWDNLGQVYRPSSLLPDVSAKRFIKQNEVKSLADSELLKALTLLDVDIEWLMKEKKELLTLAKEDKQLSVALKTLESFENNLGLNNKVKVTETRQISQNNNLEGNYNQAIADKNKIKIELSTSDSSLKTIQIDDKQDSDKTNGSTT